MKKLEAQRQELARLDAEIADGKPQEHNAGLHGGDTTSSSGTDGSFSGDKDPIVDVAEVEEDRGSEGSAPEEMTTNQVLWQEAPPESEPRREEEKASKAPCRTFVATGRCRFNTRCRFSHDKALREGKFEKGDGQVKGREERLKKGRKGLYERVCLSPSCAVLETWD